MSTRTSLRPNPVILDGDMSADITSDPTILQSLTRVSYAFSWVGTSPIGTLAVQVSNDYSLAPDGSEDNAGTWNTLPLQLDDGTIAMSVPVTGNTGNGFFEITTGAYAVRTFYDKTSGVGTLQATVVAKVA